MIKLHWLAAAFAAITLAPAVHALDLTIEVANAKVQGGTLYASLHADETGWMQTDRARASQRVEVNGERVRIVYTGLPAGRYAVTMYHDENGNGQLDKNMMGIPRERVGFSRDARGRMGPPSFADAAIDVQQDTALLVTLY